MRLLGTRDARDTAGFLAAAGGATPAHGGLFAPERLAARTDVSRLLALPWRARNVELLAPLLGDELAPELLRTILDEALDFPVPLEPLDDGSYALELFRGPTLAFKDFGARFLAGVLTRALPPRPRTILTATSGDTGSAVAHAFWKRPGVRVVVLYPRGRISELQERQMATLGANVVALSIAGSFDDCQALVKSCFADAALVEQHGLVSANSINIARLLAQCLYYFEALAQLRARGEQRPVVVSVPSGNFGNLCAGLYARALGLDVAHFVAATNANDSVPRYLDTGRYEPRSSVATLSNAMDVGAPSNWERIEHLFGGDLARLRGALRWGRADDDATRAEVRALAALDYLACPHTAVAHRVLRERLQPGEVGVFLATAHPAKFAEALEPILGRTLELPPALAALRSRPLHAEQLPHDRAALIARLAR